MTCGRSVVFSSTPVSSTNKTDRHDITEILLKVALKPQPYLLKWFNKQQCGARTAYNSGEPEFTHGLQKGSCCSIYIFLCSVFFVQLPFFSHQILSARLRITTFDSSFGIFMLLLLQFSKKQGNNKTEIINLTHQKL